MSLDRLNSVLQTQVDELENKGTAKGDEMVITGRIPGTDENGPRYLLEGFGEQPFIKMNSNSYLGLSGHPEVIGAEETTAQEYGAGPGAVRFISGTYQAHMDLEQTLAEFHRREAAMIFSSAYVTSMGVIIPLATRDTIFVSDELNHNCIIQAMRLSRPAGKAIYKHNDMADLENKIQDSIGKAKRLLVVTDGIFSMRGDHAPLNEIVKICEKYQDEFAEGIISIADDSHGVGAFGPTGRGTEEYLNTQVDILIGTLGKAFGVNGGYVVSSQALVRFLRETAPMYIYSNPITPSEAAAARKSITILDSPEGQQRLQNLKSLTQRFEQGLMNAGFETIPGEHPVVPLMVRDTVKTKQLVNHLTRNGILATGLNFPVVPKGDEEIRFQITADLTEKDIDYVVRVLTEFKP